MNVETRHVRYVFADVVRFTEDRTLEAQVEIIAALNNAFNRRSRILRRSIFLRGMEYAGILEVNVPADIHLRIAIRVLEIFHEWCSEQGFNRHAELRVAVNETYDNVPDRYQWKPNLAGVGINSSQRLMSVATEIKLL